MLEVKDECECLKALRTYYLVDSYNPEYDKIKITCYGPQKPVEEGTLCLVEHIQHDFARWEEYIPIEYCPICGKKIEYKKVEQLTKKL